VTPVAVLVALETVILALLTAVVIGLLRSHAEILRRLSATDGSRGGGERAAVSLPVTSASSRGIPDHLPVPRPAGTGVSPIEGSTLDGGAIVISPDAIDTLVAFLSSGCLTCRAFWDGMRSGQHEPLPGDARLVVVVKDRDLESPSRLRELAPTDVPVVLSSATWAAYDVPTSPYFLFVSAASRTVRSEGAASSWEQVRSLLRDAIEDESLLGGEGIERAG
jgi:hypothetical protein